MTSTSSRHADYMARDNRAASHVVQGDGSQVADIRQPDPQSPAGGVSSSVADMAHWMQMVLAEGQFGEDSLVSPEALLPAISPQVISGHGMSPADRTSTYGYGFNVGLRPSGRVVLSHSGAFALGAATSFSMIPDLDLGIIILTNAPPVGVPESIAATFLDRAKCGVDERDWLAGYGPLMAPLFAPVGELFGVAAPSEPAPAAPLDVYAGTYTNAYFGAATVRQEGGGLALEVGPAPQRLEMTHWEGDSFVVYPCTENRPEGSVSLVAFEGGDADPTHLTVEHLGVEGLGSSIRDQKLARPAWLSSDNRGNIAEKHLLELDTNTGV